MHVVSRFTGARGAPYHLLLGPIREDQARAVCGRATDWPFPIMYLPTIPLCAQCRRGAARAGHYRFAMSGGMAFPGYRLAQPPTDAT